MKRKTFLKIIRGLLPIKTQTRIEYKIKCGRWPDLKKPTRYTEKLQLYKMNYYTQQMVDCADKVKAVDYVRSKGLEHILVERYGVFDSIDEIDFSTLPDQFIMKSNTGSGNNYVVKDKKSLNIDDIRKKTKNWLKSYPSLFGTEKVYKGIKPKILIERLLPYNSKNDLPDYKFFCFDGKVFCLYVMKEATEIRDNGKLSFFDRDFNKLKYYRLDYLPINEHVDKPTNYDLMIEYAEKLSAGFPHVRVDFYNIEGEIFFGELTFYTHGGYINFEPDEFDFILGEQFNLPE